GHGPMPAPLRRNQHLSIARRHIMSIFSDAADWVDDNIVDPIVDGAKEVGKTALDKAEELVREGVESWGLTPRGKADEDEQYNKSDTGLTGDDPTSGGLWTPQQGKEWQHHQDMEAAREHAILTAHPENHISTGELLSQYPSDAAWDLADSL